MGGLHEVLVKSSGVYWEKSEYARGHSEISLGTSEVDVGHCHYVSVVMMYGHVC